MPPSGDGGGRQRRIDGLHRGAQAMREFLARAQPRRNAKGQELKSNVTDNDSAKMATSKGVIQDYAAQAAVDAAHQVIVASDVAGIRHTKRLDRFTLRGKEKVGTLWRLYCLVHTIEKLARTSQTSSP